MNIGFMILTDGRRECLERTIESFQDKVECDFSHGVIVDDSTSPEYHQWLLSYGYEVLPCEKQKRGFHGAIQAGWDSLLSSGADWIFHLEDDFLFENRVDIHAMSKVLSGNLHLAQMALKRQAVSPEEIMAGGLVQMWPEMYTEFGDDEYRWTEHGLFFTTNPSVYSRRIAEHGWPQCRGSEQQFTSRLKQEGYSFAYWGKKWDGPKVTHIGDHRTGVGY